MKQFLSKNRLKLVSIAMPFLAIISAFIVGAIMLHFAGYSPIEAGKSIIMGTFGSPKAFALTLVKSTPLMIIGVGIAIAFKGSSFNIGAEGQFFAGALGAVLCETMIRPMNLPGAIAILFILVAAILFGGAYGAIPGYFKAKRGASEVVTSVMLSSIMILLVGYLVNGPLQESSGIYAETAEIVESVKLPYILGNTKLHFGIIIAIVAAIFLFVLLDKTTFGYKVKAAGQNALAAEYAGISTDNIRILTLIISGAMAGLAGGVEILGVTWKLYVGISPGYGYNAIAVALLGKLHPIGIIFSAILFGALNTGCNQMARMIGVPSALSSLLQALVLLFVVTYTALEPIIMRKLDKGGEQ